MLSFWIWKSCVVSVCWWWGAGCKCVRRKLDQNWGRQARTELWGTWFKKTLISGLSSVSQDSLLDKTKWQKGYECFGDKGGGGRMRRAENEERDSEGEKREKYIDKAKRSKELIRRLLHKKGDISCFLSIWYVWLKDIKNINNNNTKHDWQRQISHFRDYNYSATKTNMQVALNFLRS